MIITQTQLKQINLVLTDYVKLQELLGIYEQQAFDYEELILNYKKTEQLNDERVYHCIEKIEANEQQIKQLKRSNKIAKTINKILGGIAAALGLIIVL